jgi:hypothetical protein
MGGSSYSDTDYAARTSARVDDARSRGIGVKHATFAYSHGIASGITAAKVHASLEPLGVKIRESRDSDAHPLSVPIAVIFDTTGSMSEVPYLMQEELTKLMGFFLNDKASGKKYLGEGYPALMVGGVDDFDAMDSYGGNGCLQIGQFESGIEIDDNLTNMWITHLGGGTYCESYQLAMYFLARHTVHDHFEKRGKKGYAFFIGDEHPYPEVEAKEVKAIIGDTLQSDIPTKEIIEELKTRYHVFFIIPNNTQHYNDAALEKSWVKLLGQQNVLKLAEPKKICEMIASAVAICESYADINDLVGDGVGVGVSDALVPLSKATGEVSKYSADSLKPIAGGVSTSGTTRF